MTLEEFARIQTELLWAFWPFAQAWIVLFLVAGLMMAILMFFMDFVSRWLPE